MAKLVIDSAGELEAIGCTQEDYDAFKARLVSRTWFYLDTPDPEFPEFTVEEDDQLPGRPTEGRLEVGAIFENLQLLVTDEQRKSPVNGGLIFDHLKAHNSAVFGPNVGQFLYENQHLIPVEFRGKAILMFFGKIYRRFVRNRYVRCLSWGGKSWVWDSILIDCDGWGVDCCVVVFAKKL